ncbi:MAG: MarP family serine protease, partial [Actinomycetota bacterium]
MNLTDLILLALLALALLTGWRRGAVLQAFSFGGLVVGLFVGGLCAPAVASMFRDSGGSIVALATLSAFLAAGMVGELIGTIIGSRMRVIAHRGPLHLPDSVAGSAVSATATLLSAWLLAMTLVGGPFPAVSRQVKGSAVLRGIDAVMPRPPNLFSAMRRFFSTTGFPEVFSELAAPFAPDATPDPSIATTPGVKAAAMSTFKVEGEACSMLQEGSSFVIAPGYVLTNAHVVAGARKTSLITAAGKLKAVTVLFDPQIDLAVLRVVNLKASPLKLLRSNVPSGTQGAVLGYPGGGPEQASPAAVRTRVTATGRDIYGRANVQRRVYVLRAQVRP